ncbi:hypothetical protein F2Q69_00049424 [Brassica cretica]|uniref:MATH domain-containing protein n=1 Tax=Brassica cretica TaxID=69181 RepID=A0A8S9PKC9_BRACR|nr:hypothetical protein F2Q69_00049424 [Brassica cretica]
MGQQQMEKKFTWVSPNISYCLGNTCYSRPYSVAGCDWHLSACPKGDYLCLYLELEPESLPPGWSRDVRVTFTLVNKGWRYTNKTLGAQCCFNAKNSIHGFEEFLPLSKLLDTHERFMVNYRRIVLAEIHVLLDIVVPKEPVKVIEPLSCKVSSGGSAPKEDVDDEALSLASNGSSLHQVKSLEAASQTVENGGGRRGFNNVIYVTEICNNVVKEIQPVKETMNVNGFEVFSSQSPDKLSEDDLRNADDTLADLIAVGFKLNWLKSKLNEVTEKKKMEQGTGARLKTMEEQLQKLKLMFLNLETQLQTEKVEALAARAPLSFSDVVC